MTSVLVVVILIRERSTRRTVRLALFVRQPPPYSLLLSGIQKWRPSRTEPHRESVQSLKPHQPGHTHSASHLNNEESGGCGCLNHFLEGTTVSCLDGEHITTLLSTVLHSWEVLAKILGSEEVEGVVCDIGMYVRPRF